MEAFIIKHQKGAGSHAKTWSGIHSGIRELIVPNRRGQVPTSKKPRSIANVCENVATWSQTIVSISLSIVRYPFGRDESVLDSCIILAFMLTV